VTMVVRHLGKIGCHKAIEPRKYYLPSGLNFSPFKKIIAEALSNGEKPMDLATRLAEERKMPLRTAKAYVTMVVKVLEVK